MFSKVSTGSRRRARRAAGFSLAEMMIALVILGFGLLIIGAALPVGLTYTRESVELDVGQAAAEHSLDLIEQKIRLSKTYWSDNLFRPRVPPVEGGAFEVYGTGTDGWPRHEPLIKVRPLMTINVSATSGGTPQGTRDPLSLGLSELEADTRFDVNARVEKWLQAAIPTYNQRAAWKEVDFPIDRMMRPTLSAADLVYPPVEPRAQLQVGDFFNQPYQRMQLGPVECKKALDRLVTWVAFYRRVSWKQGSDPNLYEVISVAVRRPSEEHRFPILEWNDPFHSGLIASPGNQYYPGYTGRDTLAPVPWLVAFRGLPESPGAGERPLFVGEGGATPDRNRTPVTNWQDPAQLEFIASDAVAQLLPPGSIFIPAVNDEKTAVWPTIDIHGQRRTGFVPHAPDTLPIYEVAEVSDISGTDEAVIRVDNNGFYPWLHPNINDTFYWPVWVIPPAFSSLDASGRPIYEQRSPVVAVARRYIRFTEVP